MVNYDNLRWISGIIFNLVMFPFTVYLSFINELSYNQSFMLYLGALGAVVLAEYFLISPKTSSYIKGHQILAMFPLLLGMGLLTSFFMTSSANSTNSIIILITIDLSIMGVFSIIEWIDKRKQKQILSQNSPIN